MNKNNFPVPRIRGTPTSRFTARLTRFGPSYRVDDTRCCLSPAAGPDGTSPHFAHGHIDVTRVSILKLTCLITRAGVRGRAAFLPFCMRTCVFTCNSPTEVRVRGTEKACEHPGRWALSPGSPSHWLWEGQRICLSGELRGDARAAGLGTRWDNGCSMRTLARSNLS